MRPDIVDIEWELWRDLCRQMEEAGLVTSADLKAPVAENKTSGQKLIHAVRAWGDNRKNQIARRTIFQALSGREGIGGVTSALREWCQAVDLLPKDGVA